MNGKYAQAFNRRHDRIGHVFQGRYKALLVERGAYLLEVVRYIVRNPVSAGLCSRPEDWLWSSHRATLGLSIGPACLSVQSTLRLFAEDIADSRTRYLTFVDVDRAIRDDGWSHPVVAGSGSFIKKAVGTQRHPSREIPRGQRSTSSLVEYQRAASSRNDAIKRAYDSGCYSMAELGRHFRLHYSTISRVCSRSKKEHAAADSLDTVRQFKT